GRRDRKGTDQRLYASSVKTGQPVLAGGASDDDEPGPAQRQLHQTEVARVAVREQHRLLRHQLFRFPKRRPERTPPPFGDCLRLCSIRRSSSAASGWRGSISSAFRNASTEDSGSFVRQRTPAT